MPAKGLGLKTLGRKHTYGPLSKDMQISTTEHILPQRRNMWTEWKHHKIKNRGQEKVNIRSCLCSEFASIGLCLLGKQFSEGNLPFQSPIAFWRDCLSERENLL